jgi:hypothetical protein
MKNYPILYSILILLVFSSCSSNKNMNAALLTGKKMEKPTLMGQLTETFPPTANYKINDVSLDGNYLFLSFEYQASCNGKDKFEFYGTLSDASVYPPKRNVKLVIIPSGDTCRSLEYSTQIINVSELCYSKTPNDVIDLILQGWKTKLTYHYIGTASPRN